MRPRILKFTPHALQRASQRGISDAMIETAINYGEIIYRQGLRYFICLEKNLLGLLPPSLIERYRHTVVIVGDNGMIITCYKNRDAMSCIKRKIKRLYC